MRNLTHALWTAIGLLLATASVGAVPMEILNDPTHPMSRSEAVAVDRNPQPSLAASAAALQYKSGDTVSLFCDIGTFKFGTFGGSDCWGWQGPDSTEYAIMGVYDGVVFVNTATMAVADFVPGPESSCGGARWRDMVTYQHYAYCVSECVGVNDGLMVIDMQFLPDSVHLVGTFPINNAGNRTSHNLAIDSATGFAYVEGSTSFNASCHVLSLADPENPTWVSSFGPANGIHDMFARNDTVYLAEGYNPSFSVWDLSDKDNPTMVIRVAVPASGYVHNIWPTTDGEYVVTTEETANKTVKIWDVRDLLNIDLVGQYLAPSNLAHNAQVRGDTVFLAHYESGVTVVDISDPANPTEIAAYDTWGTDNPDYNGAWGAYPYSPSGNVYGSNTDGSLFILQMESAILADTMWIDSVAADAGDKVRLDVHVTNSLPLRILAIPISWAGDYNMILDSVSTVGLRTEYFEDQRYVGKDSNNRRMAYGLTAALAGSSPDLAPGTGPVLSLYFSIPPGAAGATNPVVITPYNSTEATFGHNCIAYSPEVFNGAVTVAPVCCVLLRGNVNGDPADDVNVADVSYLVAYLFSGGPDPLCAEEANVNGDLTGDINVADLTRLVAYLFQGGPIPALCP